MTNQAEEHDIIPASLAIKAMRDSGYKNAAYALAELVDNAIQAEASRVEILCGDKTDIVDQRSRSRIDRIAVLDNGSGMDAEVLHMALQFGNGLYLDPRNHTGIGRFGMGLPSSSISQCRRVDVWSWTNGPDTLLHTYLDLDEIEEGTLTRIPKPAYRDIPNIWLDVTNSFESAGTLVVWSGIDRCLWKTSRAIIHNSEELVGRIYRRFITQGRTTILFKTFDVDNPTNILTEKAAHPNDPCYLMAETSCPAPFDKQPMFMPWPAPESYEVRPIVSFRGEQQEVIIRFSIATEEARSGAQAGSKPHGKHAKRNVGVSLMRADRELELDAAWAVPYDPRERWWGVEIDFPPALDDLFGVTNNKQSARNFSDIARMIATEDQVFEDTIAELEAAEDPRLPLYEITQRIDKNIRMMRRQIAAQKSGERERRSRHSDPSSPPAIATEATQRRRDEGHVSHSDEEERTLPVQERKIQVQETLVASGIPEKDAEELAAFTIDSGLKYIFDVADLEGSAFFTVRPKGGVITVLLNVNHPAYEQLLEVLETGDIEDEEDIETLQSRLQRASKGLKLLLLAWARYEDEQLDGVPRERTQDARTDWGKIARDFMRQE